MFMVSAAGRAKLRSVFCAWGRTDCGFKVTLTGTAGQDAQLFQNCTGACARPFEQLGIAQWEKALGTAEHCAKCSLVHLMCEFTCFSRQI